MFHVPEQNRLEGKAGVNAGVFLIKRPQSDRRKLYIIASSDLGWEHVSVHVELGKHLDNSQMATPTWDEMCFIKDLFWDEEDAVMQIHPQKSRYVNIHPNTLHLWRPIGKEIPLPSMIFV